MRSRVSLCALAFASTAAVVQATGFNDESAWQSAVGTFQAEPFEGFANLTPVCRLPNVDLYLSRLSTKVHAATVMDILTTGGTATSGSNVLVNQMAPVLPGLGPIRMYSSKAGQSIKGLGYWNTGGDDSTVLRFYDVNGVLIESSDTGSIASVFNGIVSDVVVGWVEIDAGALGNGYFTLDDLQVAFAPVPDGVTLPSPEEESNEVACAFAVPATVKCGAKACAVELYGQPGAVGIVYALGGPLASPLGAVGPLAAHPGAERLAVVKANSSGKALLGIQLAELADRAKDAMPPQTWTLQVMWVTANGPKEHLIIGPHFGLRFD
jgi:hypothetical protein